MQISQKNNFNLNIHMDKMRCNVCDVVTKIL